MRIAFAALLLVFAQVSQAQLYWRGDIGWSKPGEADIRDKNFAADGLICGDAACNSGGKLDDINGSLLVGVGVGWRFNQNLRADVRLSYAGWYELDDSDALPSNFKADISSLNLMLNGYYDFVLAWGRPYVGAGIGFASNKIDSITNSGGALGTASITAPGGTSSDFAWALMAGIAFPLNPTMTLDVGYRFIDLGKIESDSGALTCSPACPGATYSGLTGNLRAHEFTVGLRF